MSCNSNQLIAVRLKQLWTDPKLIWIAPSSLDVYPTKEIWTSKLCFYVSSCVLVLAHVVLSARSPRMNSKLLWIIQINMWHKSGCSKECPRGHYYQRTSCVISKWNRSALMPSWHRSNILIRKLATIAILSYASNDESWSSIAAQCCHRWCRNFL